MDISAAIIHKILVEQDLEVYSKLKLVFLDSAYSSLYSVIGNYYEKYSKLPTFEDLEITLRSDTVGKTLAAIKLLEIPDVPAMVMLDALIDQYTQSEAIKLLDPFLDKLPLYDSEEIKEAISSMALTLEEKTHTSETVYTMNDLMVFYHQEDIDRERVYLALNNEFDATIGGMARQEVLFLGGRRGSGKSLVSSNMFINQYLAGNASLFFSIEMTAFETHQRHLAMLTGIPLMKIKGNKLDKDEILRLVKCRAAMFKDAEDTVERYQTHCDRFKFEEDLVRNYNLKENNQMVIVDDRNLTLGSIDLHMGKAKARFGDNLKVVVVDYINQIFVEGIRPFDWQLQIEIAKKLKNLARKYEVVLISPYQIDSTGEARFSKGILDSADISLTLEPHENAISFTSTKMRGAPQVSFTSPIDWETLRISPQSIEKPEKVDKDKKEKKAKTGEPEIDLPWDT